MMEILELQNVTICYNEQVLFAPLSVSINQGDKLVFVGESGVGKSSLLLSLMGFESISEGKLFYNGKPYSVSALTAFRHSVAWLPQEIQVQANQTVLEFLFTPFHFELNKRLKPSIEEVQKLFAQLNLKPELLNGTMAQLSGGEKQRIALACALLLKREVLILDEPVSGLDKLSKKMVMELLFSDEKRTIISTSHDASWISACTTQITLQA